MDGENTTRGAGAAAAGAEALPAAAAFLASFLLFTLELLAAKLLLPGYGGGAQVWTTCMMFFQGALLAGYLYAHAGSARLSPRRQALLHLFVLGAGALALPPGFGAARPGSPVAGLLADLAAGAGLPFLALSATVPLLQRWSSARGRSGDPYVLYAWSNAGALGALLAYPFLLEPLLGLGAQARSWQWGYLAFCAAMAACLPPREGGTAAPGQGFVKVSAGDALAWAALAAAPCAAMLAATSFLSLTLAAVPLLWVAPLAVYLLTYVLNFGRAPLGEAAWNRALLFFTFPAAFAAAAALLGSRSPAWAGLAPALGFLLNLAALFAVSMICHRSLAAARPAGEGRASSYYLAISAGGLFAGALMGLALPHFGRHAAWPGLEWLAAGLLSIAALAARDREAWRRRRGAPALLAAGLALLPLAALPGAGGAAYRVRNFYGISSVEERDGARVLLHGNTQHGLQYLDPERRDEPTLYFHRGSPVGDAFRLFGRGVRDAGVIGLGAGTLASYGRPGMKMTFYELDPDVAEIARERFTFLARSAAAVRVVPGDGRLSLERETGTRHDLLVLDAYSSGAIPTHLLTLEAFRLYLGRLVPGGLVLCHISNRYLDLAPVLAAGARALGLAAAVRTEEGAGGEGRTRWAALSADASKIAELLREPGWVPLRDDGARPWTDSYAALLPLIRPAARR